MPLGFVDLSMKDLANTLSVHGLNTSGREVELVARVSCLWIKNGYNCFFWGDLVTYVI